MLAAFPRSFQQQSENKYPHSGYESPRVPYAQLLASGVVIRDPSSSHVRRQTCSSMFRTVPQGRDRSAKVPGLWASTPYSTQHGTWRLREKVCHTVASLPGQPVESESKARKSGVCLKCCGQFIIVLWAV